MYCVELESGNVCHLSYVVSVQ